MTGEFDSTKHPVEAFVRAAWRSENAIETFECGLRARLRERWRRRPFAFHRDTQMCAGMLERFVSRLVRGEPRIKVSDDPNSNRHALFKPQRDQRVDPRSLARRKI